MSIGNNVESGDFLISNYDTPRPEQMISKITKAQKWCEDTGRVMIIPGMNDFDKLENTWIAFNGMIKKHRRESDWKSIEIFGVTNQEQYNKLRGEYLLADIENETESDHLDPVSESYISAEDSYYSPESINYTSSDVEKAREWASESDRVIIVPTRTLAELEELWDGYNMMIKKHRRESDWTSTELFGVTNLKHYEHLKSQFLKDDLRAQDVETYGSLIECTTLAKTKKYFNQAIEESAIETARSLMGIINPCKGIYEEVVTANIVSGVLDRYDADVIEPSSTIDFLGYGDLPYFSPEEMIDMGVFGQSPVDNHFGVIADNSNINDTTTVREWFEKYRIANRALCNEFSSYSSDWVNKVRELSYGLKSIEESGDEKAILARKQSLLELGWDPNIEFSTKARMVAKESSIARMKSNYSGARYRVIDLTEFTAQDQALTESAKTNLKPVYVCMIEGKSYFSKAIKTLTRDIYSHVAISLDPSLHEMYSYGINTNANSERSGFRREDISDLPIGGRIGLFVFFVSEEAHRKIFNFIQSFKDNAEKTSYSYLNLITYLFNIPYSVEWKLVCSQFVDRCLQAADINITGAKSSSLVAPGDLNKALRDDKKIYKLYEGLHNKYDEKRTQNLVNALITKAKPIKESSKIYTSSEAHFVSTLMNNITDLNMIFEMQESFDVVRVNFTRKLIEEMVFEPLNIRPIGEAKEFPVQFDKEGNLLIKNLKKLDYEAEYAKSHKLLKEYLKAKNYEGIKYELSKLWMMLCLIEEKIHSKKFQDLPSMAIASSAEHKAKAKITNDFKYYMEKMLEAEPDFNFTEYYEATPFSSSTTKINNSTMVTVGSMIKKFIKSI